MTVFSILLPVEARSEKLDRTLASIKKQTHDAWTCICVTQDSLEEIDVWLMVQAELDPRIIPTHAGGTAAGGVIPAWTHGLNLSGDTQVVICTPGDVFSPDFLETMAIRIAQGTEQTPYLMISQTALLQGDAQSETHIDPQTDAHVQPSVRAQLARLGLPVRRFGSLRLLPNNRTYAGNASIRTTLLHKVTGQIAKVFRPVTSFFEKTIAGVKGTFGGTRNPAVAVGVAGNEAASQPPGPVNPVRRTHRPATNTNRAPTQMHQIGRPTYQASLSGLSER